MKIRLKISIAIILIAISSTSFAWKVKSKIPGSDDSVIIVIRCSNGYDKTVSYFPKNGYYMASKVSGVFYTLDEIAKTVCNE